MHVFFIIINDYTHRCYLSFAILLQVRRLGLKVRVRSSHSTEKPLGDQVVGKVCREDLTDLEGKGGGDHY